MLFLTFFRYLLYYKHLSKGGIIIKIKTSSLVSVLIILIVAILSGCTQGNESFTTELALCEGDVFYLSSSADNALTFYGVTIDKDGNQKVILQIKDGYNIVEQKEIGIGNSTEITVFDDLKTWRKKITVKEIKRVKIDGEEKFAVIIRIESTA